MQSYEAERRFFVPVAEVTLESEEVLVETLDGLLLQDVVDAIPSVQHPHLHLRLLLPLQLRALWDLMLCEKMTSHVSHNADETRGRIAGKRNSPSCACFSCSSI